MKDVLRIMVLIGIACRNVPAAIVGMIIGNFLFFLFGSFMEWKYPR